MPARAKEPPGRIVSRHHVRARLEEMILSGRSKPGSKLVQQELAGRLGVSQGVIREALLELQAFGLVETIDNRGMFVGKLDLQTLLESFEVREVHEGLSARLCCGRITREQVAELRTLVQKIFELGAAGRLDEMGQQDRAFHDRLTRLSGNTTLARLAANYKLLGKVVRANRDPREVRAEHTAILAAIEAGKTDDAERLMREHIRAARKAVEEQIRKGLFVPHWVV